MTRIGKLARRFLGNEDGLVTVEWVAIAAAVCVGAIALCWVVLESLDAPAANIGTQLSGVAPSS